MIAPLLFALIFSCNSGADSNESEFRNKIKLMTGKYRVVSSTHELCEDAELIIVENDFEKGFFLGQDIYFGPFGAQGSVEEQNPNYCKFRRDMKFSKNKLTQVTELSNCKDKFKKDESISHKSIQLSENMVVVEIVESKLKCVYKRMK